MKNRPKSIGDFFLGLVLSPSRPMETFSSLLPDVGSPRHPWGYDYGAKLRIAPTELPPARSAASLAARPLARDLLDHGFHRLAVGVRVPVPPADAHGAGPRNGDHDAADADRVGNGE